MARVQFPAPVPTRVATRVAIALAGALLTSCAGQRAAAVRPPAPAGVAQLLADPAVDRVTRGLQSRGFELKAPGVSRVELLADAPGAAFAVADGALHVHAYRDEAAAAAAVGRIVNAPAGRYRWQFPPIFYQCGSAIAVYAASRPSVASALRELCASPFYVHPSLREHNAELLAEGPGELRSQVSRLDVRRRQINAHIRRQARQLPGGAKCRGTGLPDSAFVPVEVTGDSVPELAVALGRLGCPAGAFAGPAGGTVQFWSSTARSPRLILEQQVHGFAPRDGLLVTLQNGGACAAAGPKLCLVTYRWDPKQRRMLVAARAAVAAKDGLAAIAFDHQLRRVAAGPAGQ
ncbi:MAG TPA: hypothetical protein VFS45_02015 [Sphingomicrobium sp.]|nr:hypothetical protein [Sphingomicrobium sp.]